MRTLGRFFKADIGLATDIAQGHLQSDDCVAG